MTTDKRTLAEIDIHLENFRDFKSLRAAKKWRDKYDRSQEVIARLVEAATEYLGNGHEPTDSDTHNEKACRQCKSEKAIAKATALQEKGEK